MFPKIIFLATLFLFFGKPFEENPHYSREYYETGNLKAEGWLKDGVKTDYWKFYHPNGKLSEEGHYKSNRKEKYWHFYFQTGKPEKEGHFENGKMTDWWLFYDQTGRVNHKCQLSNGKKNGYCLRYSNEKLTSAEKYRNGKKIKEWFSLGSFRKENSLSDLH